MKDAITKEILKGRLEKHQLPKSERTEIGKGEILKEHAIFDIEVMQELLLGTMPQKKILTS